MLAPISARELEQKARSRTLPLSWVGRSISEINTNWDWSSHVVNGSAKVVGLTCSEGCQLLWSRLKSPAINEGLEKKVCGKRVRARAASPGLIELERVPLYTLAIRSDWPEGDWTRRKRRSERTVGSTVVGRTWVVQRPTPLRT